MVTSLQSLLYFTSGVFSYCNVLFRSVPPSSEMSLQTVGKQQKYGLISKKKPRLDPRNSAFNVAEDDEEVGDDILKASREMFKQKKVQVDVLEDNSYDYDGEYDQIKKQREEELRCNLSSSGSLGQSSRYIANLKASAKVREREKERIFEKILLKEREEEDKMFSNKPKFITSAYKEKLKESQRWEYEDKLAEELEKRKDVRSAGMHGFYSNLLTKNIAMGNDVEGNALSAYTAGSERQKKLETSEDTQHTQSSQHPLIRKDLPLPDPHEKRSGDSQGEIVESNEGLSSIGETNSNYKQDRSTFMSTEDRIAEAKQRYLARKRGFQETEPEKNL